MIRLRRYVFHPRGGWHDPIFIGNYYASRGDSRLIVDSPPASSLTEELTAMVANTAGNFGPLLGQPLRKPASPRIRAEIAGTMRAQAETRQGIRQG